MSEHSLEKPTFVTAGVLFGSWGVGLTVTQTIPPLFWVGIVICLGSAIFTLWRYYEPGLASLRGRADALPRWEGGAVSLLVLVEIIGALYFAVPELASKVHHVWAYFRPAYEVSAHITHRTTVSPIQHHPRSAPPSMVATAPVLTVPEAAPAEKNTAPMPQAPTQLPMIEEAKPIPPTRPGSAKHRSTNPAQIGSSKELSPATSTSANAAATISTPPSKDWYRQQSFFVAAQSPELTPIVEKLKSELTVRIVDTQTAATIRIEIVSRYFDPVTIAPDDGAISDTVRVTVRAVRTDNHQVLWQQRFDDDSGPVEEMPNSPDVDRIAVAQARAVVATAGKIAAYINGSAG